MHPTLLLAAIVPAVSAIDLYLRSGDCGSSGIVCPNLNPNTCCGRQFQEFQSVQLRAIPAGWNLNLRAHGDTQCGAVKDSRNGVGPGDICITFPFASNWYSGGGYSFNGKRSVDKDLGCEKPSRLEFFDGPVYDISEMQDGPLGELLAIAASGANSSAVPAQFAQFAKI